jgi:hypothetical protein
MADAFREGVPLGWQRAFVALADAYREVVAERDALRGAAGLDTDEVEMMGRYLRFPLPDGSTQLVSRPLFVTGEPVPMRLDVDALQAEMDAAEAALPTDLSYESLAPRVYRARQTRNGMEITRSNDWPAPEHDAGPDWTYPPLPDIDIAQENRRARRALLIACALALAVAGFVYFLG